MNRRQFLKGAGALGALAGCQTSPRSAISNASSAGWGQALLEQQQFFLPKNKQPDGMLELFLVGGLSPWESFYTVPQYGRPPPGSQTQGKQFWTYFDDPELSLQSYIGGCEWAGRPLYQPFRLDGAGVNVNLGPFVHPLRDRPDILARLRVWVMAHDTEPHPAAIPYALTGHRVGSPRLASHGAHVQAYYQDLLGSTAPMSYALYLSSVNVGGEHGAAGAVGLHRASARPLALQLGQNLRLVEQVYRPGVREHARSIDALVNHYVRRQSERLVTPSGLLVRSAGLADFASAQDAMSQYDVVARLLDARYFDLPIADVCAGGDLSPRMLDETTPALRLAAHLLTNGSAPARHVTVMDAGINPDPVGQGYDSHASQMTQQGTNVLHAMKGLASIVNRPGENDPEKLDLDRHFVLINTEFGRAPVREVTIRNPTGLGTNHWPWGYVVVGFGAWADEDRSTIVGSIGEDARAVASISPEELRAGLLLAQGIWPFAPEAFAVGDLRVSTSQADAAAFLREHVLGYPI